MRILYLGDDSVTSTSRHRAEALERLGHEVLIRPISGISGIHMHHPVWGRLQYWTGFRFAQRRMLEGVRQRVSAAGEVDLVWIDGGELLGPDCVRYLRSSGRPVLLFNADDPTGRRDGQRFLQVCRSAPHYDLMVTVRTETVDELRALGAPRVLRVYRTYDELRHAPGAAASIDESAFRCDVAFVGTWMRRENRDRFALALKESGLEVGIWGSHWHRSPVAGALGDSIRGGAIYGPDYVAALRAAKVCLGFLSKGNRDLHTNRSAEIPYAGGLLCAQRTTEHQRLYREGEEAVFWSSTQECIERCKQLLADEALRERIRLGGMRRVRELGIGNENLCQAVLDALADPRAPASLSVALPFYS